MNALKFSAPLFALLSMLTPAWAADTKIEPADTAFIIVATALVLMMTLPGLALFYAGMVRRKNVLGTMAQSAAAVAIVSVLWFAIGYSLAFSGSGPVIGDFGRAFMAGVGLDSTTAVAPTIPEMLFCIYQMTFAVITCALVGGSVADRMKFSAFCLFCVFWLFIVYIPSAHMVWGGGALASLGVVDFAGGAVVHINAGVAGLVAAFVIGSRRGYGKDNMSPFDLSLAVVGTGLLWVGWFGFNGGSALSAGGRAVFAIMATHLAACAGAIVWSLLEWLQRGKPSVLGIISGAIAGLGTITPASGFVLPWHGVVIGAVAGGVCYYFCTIVKMRLKYDDSLDVFGVHGVGGILGMLMVGVFATASLSASGETAGVSGLIEGNVQQLWIQAVGVLVTALWCGAGTWLVLKIVDAMCGLRMHPDEEMEGVDLSMHGEAIHQ